MLEVGAEDLRLPLARQAARLLLEQRAPRRLAHLGAELSRLDRLQALPDLLGGAQHLLLGRRQADAQVPGDLGHGEPQPEAQDDHLAVVAAHPRQRLLEADRVLAALGPLGRDRAEGRRVRRSLQSHRRLGRARAQLIDRGVADGGEEGGAQVGGWVALRRSGGAGGSAPRRRRPRRRRGSANRRSGASRRRPPAAAGARNRARRRCAADRRQPADRRRRLHHDSADLCGEAASELFAHGAVRLIDPKTSEASDSIPHPSETPPIRPPNA